jgi:4-hydroxybenzoyl-CoA reductase subunit beta
MSELHEFTLHRAGTAHEAAALLAAGARALAGGTDLLPNLRHGLERPAQLVDLTRVAGLDAIELHDGALVVGAGVTLARLASDARIAQHLAALAEAAAAVAGPGHRSAATLGGNLCQDTRCIFYNQSEWWRAGNGYCLKYRGDTCHVVVKSDRCYATYHGDVAPALIVLGAEAEIVGPSGRRTIPLADMFQEDGANRLTLAPGEWLTSVVVPPPGRWRAAYEKARVRDAVDFPLAGVAVALERDADVLTGLRVVITGTNSAPLAVPTDSVVGAAWDDAAAQTLAKAVRDTANVLATTVATVRYRRRMLQALTRKLTGDLWAESARTPSAPR